jgi:LemA protein
MTPLVIVILVLALIVLWVVVMYNGLIRFKNRVAEALSDIDVQIKRRYDLIPNLIETVKGYATHEKQTLENVISARNSAMAVQGKGDFKAQAEAENVLSGTLKTIFALSENYPDLKANQNFLELQRELSDTEDKIQASRRFYNGNVRDFNTKLQVFPTNLFAQMMNFTAYDFFEAVETEKQNITVKF